MNFVPRNYGHSFLMVVDGATILHPENPLVIVDLWDEPGREFRAIPSQIQSIENNLSLGNMGFAEFADVVDCDSIFRGFPIH